MFPGCGLLTRHRGSPRLLGPVPTVAWWQESPAALERGQSVPDMAGRALDSRPGEFRFCIVMTAPGWSGASHILSLGPPGPDRLEGGWTVLQMTPRAARAPFHGISPGRQLSGQAPPRNTQESEAAVWGWPWPCPRTSGPPGCRKVTGSHAGAAAASPRPSPPLPRQAAFDLQPALAPLSTERPAGMFFPFTFRPRAWLVEWHGISTPLTGCATTLQTHFKFNYCYHYFQHSELL